MKNNWVMEPGHKISNQPAGYSGTPLAKKLGIKPGFNIKLVNAPDYYLTLFTDLPGDLHFNDESHPQKGPYPFFY